MREVVGLLAKLRPSDAEILRLAAWEGMSTHRRAVLDLAPDAAKQRLSRARKRLAAMHEKQTRIDRRSPPLLGKEVRGEQ